MYLTNIRPNDEIHVDQSKCKKHTVSRQRTTALNTTHPLHSFLWPRTVAVIGASPDRSKLRGLFTYMLQGGAFPGRIVPVSATHREIDGLKTRGSIQEAGEAIDLAILAIPAEATVEELRRCAAAGVRNAVVVSSGFAEEAGAGRAMQEEMTLLAQSTGMRICGPNNVGFYNAAGRVAATFSQTLASAWREGVLNAGGRKVAILSQSGAIGFGLLGCGFAKGLDFSYVVTTGNEADLTISDFLDYMAGDPETGVIVIFCESIRDPQRFEEATAKAVAAGKSVVAVKAGRSGAGSRATASHTASLSGSSVAYEALFAKYGIVQADGLEEATALAALLSTTPVPRGRRFAVITVSGGLGALVCDELERNGLEVPVLGDLLQAEIRRGMPSYGTAQNPIDVTAQGVSGGALTASILALEASDEIDGIIVASTLASEATINFDQQLVAGVVQRARKPLVFYSCTPPARNVLQKLAVVGISVQDNLRTMGLALQRNVNGRPPRISLQPASSGMSAETGNVLEQYGTGTLSEFRSKQMLAALGLPVEVGRLARTAKEAKDFASALGYPVALKIQSPDIPHKTEAGGVRLGLSDGTSTEAAFDAIVSSARSYAPGALIEGVLVQTMAGKGSEVIIGMVRDRTWGPLLMVGVGGVTVEVFRDVAYGLAPLVKDEALNMLRSLKTFTLLQGFRGAATVPLDRLVELIVQVSEVAAWSGGRLSELELNPVILHHDGTLTVVDALVTLAGGQEAARIHEEKLHAA